MNNIKAFIKGERAALKSELHTLEYILWWVLRFLMLAALIYHAVNEPDGIRSFLLTLNLTASFTIPLMRLLLVPKRIFGRIPFRCQSWLNLFIFFASFLSHGLLFNANVQSWDKALHFMSGFCLLLIGNEIIGLLLRRGDRISPFLRAFCGAGTSFMAIVAWEIYEFIVDYNWEGSNNLAYNISPDRDPLFVWLFGGPSVNFDAGLASLFDTMTDMLCAGTGTVYAAVFLCIYLERAEIKEITYTGTQYKY